LIASFSVKGHRPKSGLLARSAAPIANSGRARTRIAFVPIADIILAASANGIPAEYDCIVTAKIALDCSPRFSQRLVRLQIITAVANQPYKGEVMQQETWQQLLSFESRDLVSTWFNRIHGRDLNARRAKEIIAAAKQAREFFRNAHAADNSVKPLLTFYGVASLARAPTLLLRRDGGEETLTRGHGLETIEWANQLSGDLSVGLAALNGLKIRTCSGLFMDFVRQTENRMLMHVRSSAVEWRFNYDQPSLGDEMLFGELTARIPDLHKEHNVLGIDPIYVRIQELTYDASSGVNIKVPSKSFKAFQQTYSQIGYDARESGDWTTLTGSADLFSKMTPQFMHAYIHKTFGRIPNLFLVAPMPSGNRYSQLAFTYMISYVLGMLARYFPTHWVSLAQGNKGDALWPTLNRAHRVIENSFPELVAEMIEDILANTR
jgi:hypothetical protein